MSDPYGERPDRPQSSGPHYGQPPNEPPVHEQETRAQQIPQQPQQTGQGYGPGYGQYGSGVYGQSGESSQPSQGDQPSQGGPDLTKRPPATYGQQPNPYAEQYGGGQYTTGQYGAGYGGQYPAQPGYGAPYQGGSPYVAYQEKPSNGLAIASLVTSLCGIFLCFIGSLVGIGLGIAALSQAKKTGAGRGMAIAGIVIGAVEIVLGIGFFIVLFATGSSSSS
ncbi:DUF4190 domain-containing protein [Flexivirga sp. ID2601S]|uniref:DUF4190 domain-containing protein n=1 Tax=Flexivirga aerilata TaxID=1656889 RepID=A0A849AJK5_9MICO|nr:DUF4190 domain-containing protein [Flexivirga aerilata]NNG38580.1 DUF4190 domain-containing protein [Flexivirga aerilata]